MAVTASGSRVIAVVSINNNVAHVLGEGTYVGDEVPDAKAFPHLRMFSDNNIPNPRINLDSGGTVWGCECWWGGVAKMKARLASCEIVKTTPEEMRTVKESATHPTPHHAGNYASDDVQSL